MPEKLDELEILKSFRKVILKYISAETTEQIFKEVRVNLDKKYGKE